MYIEKIIFLTFLAMCLFVLVVNNATNIVSSKKAKDFLNVFFYFIFAGLLFYSWRYGI